MPISRISAFFGGLTDYGQPIETPADSAVEMLGMALQRPLFAATAVVPVPGSLQRPEPLSSWAAKTLHALRQTDSGRVSEYLHTAVEGVENRPGYTGLEPSDQALLTSLAHGEFVEPHRAVHLLQLLSGDLFRQSSDSDPVAKIVQILGSPATPEEEQGIAKSSPRYIREVSPTLQTGESFLGGAGALTWQKICEHLGIHLPDEAHPHNIPGAFTIAKTSHVPKIPRPVTIEDGEELYTRHQATEIQATDAYYESQLRSMTATERDQYQSSAEAVARLADQYRCKTQELMNVCRSAGGRPSSKPLNDALSALEEEIYRNSHLQSKNIDPLKLFILSERRRLETWVGDQQGYEFLRENAFMLEGDYVSATIAAQATERMQAGDPEERWQHYDRLAARAKAVYERLARGTKGNEADQHGSDLRDLAFFREHYFSYENSYGDSRLKDLSPHTIDWHSREMRVVRFRLEVYETEEKKDAAAKKAYHGKVGFDVSEWNNYRLQVSLERDKVDIAFQVDRLKEQFGLLKRRLAKAQKELSDDEEDFFTAYMADLEKGAREAFRFTSHLRQKIDETARESRRNSLNKAVSRVLGLRLNLFLEDLYQLYFPEEYQATLKRQKRERTKRQDPRQSPPGAEDYRPTWISFGYNRLLRSVDDAIVNDTISRDHIRGYFDRFIAVIPEVYRELGLRGVPGGGRKAMDRYRINQIEAGVGLSTTEQEDPRFVLYGLGDQASLLLSQVPHSDLKRSDPMKEVYPPGFFERLQRWPVRKLWTAAHSGSEEFPLMLALTAFGFPAPQVMEQAVTNIPLAGEYAEAVSGALDRRLGSEATTALLLDNARRARTNGQYRGGTRNAADVAFDLYANPRKATDDGRTSYANLHAYRVMTDFSTSGLTPKLGLLWREMAAQTGVEMHLVSLVYEARYPEPTLNFGGSKTPEAILQVILDNSANDTGFSLKRNAPRRVAFAGVYPAGSFLSEPEIRALPDQDRVAQFFTHPWENREMTTREAYFATLQFNDALIQWDQEMAAYGMNLCTIPAQTLAQQRLEHELRKLSPQEQEQRTRGPLYDHMRDRLQRAGLDREQASEVPAISKERQPPAQISEETRARLNEALPRDKAEHVIRGLLEIQQTLSKGKRPSETVRDHLIEMSQRGAAYGMRMQALGRKVAFDADSVLWDHVFELEPEQIPEALRKTLADRLSDPGITADEVVRFLDKQKFTEVINVLPAIVAFFHGYRKATGDAPTIFSSTETDRFLRIAMASKEEPMVRELFEALLGIDLSSLSRPQIQRRIDQAFKDKKIITRTQIAAHVVDMMGRYQRANYKLDAEDPETGRPVFNDIEKQDIMTMLQSDGDNHFKYRGLFGYDELVDDRRENCRHAAAYRHCYGRQDSSQVTRVHQPQRPFASSPLQQYISFKLGRSDTHTAARLNGARDGMMAQVLRQMEEAWAGRWPPSPTHIHYARKQAPRKVPGLRDAPFAAVGSFRSIRQNYQEVQRLAAEAVQVAKTELLVRAEIQEGQRQSWGLELVSLYQDENNYPQSPDFEEDSPRQTIIKNACDFLLPEKGEMKPITWKNRDRVMRPIRFMKGDTVIDRAQELVAALDTERHYIDQVQSLKPGKDRGDHRRASSALPRQISGAAQYVGGLLQHVMASNVQNSLPEIPLDKPIVGGLAYAWHRLTGGKNTRALLSLARALSKKSDKKGKSDSEAKTEELAPAYGVAIQQLGVDFVRFFLWTLSHNDLVDDSTRAQLQTRRQQLERNAEIAGIQVQDVSSRLIAETPVITGRAKKTARALTPIVEQDGAVRDAVYQVLVGAIVQFCNGIQDQQAAKGLRVADTSRGDGFMMADLALFVGIRLIGGESRLGQLFRRARVRLHELGWEGAAHHLLHMLTAIKLEATLGVDGGLMWSGPLFDDS